MCARSPECSYLIVFITVEGCTIDMTLERPGPAKGAPGRVAAVSSDDVHKVTALDHQALGFFPKDLMDDSHNRR